LTCHETICRIFPGQAGASPWYSELGAWLEKVADGDTIVETHDRKGKYYHYVRQVSFFKTAFCYLILQSRAMLICRGTLFRIKERIVGPGRLVMGCVWPGGFFRQSELSVCKDSVIEIRGSMKVYTGSVISVNGGGRLSLGSGYVNCGTQIHCFNAISIGDDVSIAENVCIRDSDNHLISGNKTESGPIHIGDRVWIGMNAIILKGVTIGDGAVVAAGAVVTRDVEANTLVAGVPARFVRQATWR